MSGWMGGWLGVDKKGSLDFLTFKYKTKMCYFQIYPDELATAIKSKVISKLNLKTNQWGGKQLKN